MKLITKNGELRINNDVFIPAIENSEIEVDQDDFVVDSVEVGRGMFEEYLKPGRYKRIRANVLVTRYYRIE